MSTIEEINEELYSSILSSILKYRQVDTIEDMNFVEDIAREALEGVIDFFTELKEALAHQRDTIKKLMGKS